MCSLIIILGSVEEVGAGVVVVEEERAAVMEMEDQGALLQEEPTTELLSLVSPKNSLLYNLIIINKHGHALGLPPTGSWQDLKDHMREAGDVCYADTFKDGTGMVEFLRYEDMKYAIKKLDDSRFRSHEVQF